MLLIADRHRSGAERRVASWLGSWTGRYRIPGVALANCYVSRREVDLVIVTPFTTVVAEVKGVAPDITAGVLTCGPNERWRVAGFDGDPISVRANDRTPYDQARDCAIALNRTAAPTGGGGFVTGLVLVVPPRNSTLQLVQSSPPPQGCEALLCHDQNPLRAWFHRAHHKSCAIWTAEQVYALIEELGLGDRISLHDLITEGFPAQPEQSPDTSPSAASTEPDSPVVPVPAPGRTEPPRPAERDSADREPGPPADIRDPAYPESAATPPAAQTPTPSAAVAHRPVHTDTVRADSRHEHAMSPATSAIPGDDPVHRTGAAVVPPTPRPTPRPSATPPPPSSPPDPGLSSATRDPAHADPAAAPPGAPPTPATATATATATAIEDLPEGTDDPSDTPVGSANRSATASAPPASPVSPPPAGTSSSPSSPPDPAYRPGSAAGPSPENTGLPLGTPADTPPPPDPGDLVQMFREPVPEQTDDPTGDPLTEQRRRGWAQTAAAFVVIAVLGAGLWFVGQARGSAGNTERTTDNSPVVSIVEQPPAAVRQPPATRQRPPGTAPPAPAPTSATSCYPFQSDC